jgi:hypothetical protein
MKHVLRKMQVLIGFGAVAFSLAAAAATPRLQAGEESAFAVPRMIKPPVIDGTIAPGEWREAAAVSGTLDAGTDFC